MAFTESVPEVVESEVPGMVTTNLLELDRKGPLTLVYTDHTVAVRAVTNPAALL